LATGVIQTSLFIGHSCFDIRHFPAAAPEMTPTTEICILAGGLSARMGRDKTRLRLGGKTLLRHVQDAAGETARPVRVIRRDLVARCGPLGGVYTALQTSAADSVLFLACDMPFVTVELIEKLIELRTAKTRAVFTRNGLGRKAGFPFILSRNLMATVQRQLAQQDYSLQTLAARCRAKIFTVRLAAPVLCNVNTPGDWEAARKWRLTMVGNPTIVGSCRH
jgi:molybdopterin-guanine dinucleotide biosynthesis protein A